LKKKTGKQVCNICNFCSSWLMNSVLSRICRYIYLHTKYW
jgi:hypothetical protein